MTCTTSRLGLFCHKIIKRDTLVRDTAIDKTQQSHNVSFLMCGTKQKSPTLTLKKWGFSGGQRAPDIICRTRREIQSPTSNFHVKQDRDLISRRTARDGTLLCGQVREPSKIHAGGQLVPGCATSIPHDLPRWVSRGSPISALIPQVKQIYRPLSLTESLDNGCSIFERSGKCYSHMKRSRTDDDILLPDQKRRRLDGQETKEYMDVEDESKPSPYYDSSKGLPDLIPNHSQSTGTLFKKALSVTVPVLPNSEILHKGMGISSPGVYGEKQFKEESDICHFQNKRMKHQLETLHEIMGDCPTGNITSKSLGDSVGSPHTQSSGRFADDVSSLNSRTSKDSLSSCSPTGISDFQISFRPQGITRSTNICTSDRYRRPQMWTDVSKTNEVAMPLCDLQNIMPTSGRLQQHMLSFPVDNHVILEASQSFMLMIDNHLRVVFVSRNVRKHLGYQQAHMVGRSIGHFIHPADLSKLLRLVSGGQLRPDDRNCFPPRVLKRMFCVSMKFCRGKSGGCAQETSYLPVHWKVYGRLKTRGRRVKLQDLVVLCRPECLDSVLGISVRENMFISCHDIDFRIIYCDPRMVKVLGLERSDQIGQTMFFCHCPQDVQIFILCNKPMMLKGASNLSCYRCESRSGARAWLLTQAHLVYDSWHRPQRIVCKNYILSNEEAKQLLSQVIKDSDVMKCSDISIATDLSLMDLDESNYLSMKHYTKSGKICNGLFTEYVLGSYPLHCQVNSLSTSKQRRKIKFPYMDACCILPKVRAIKTAESSKDIYAKLTKNSTLDSGFSSSGQRLIIVSELCSSSAAISSSLHEADTSFKDIRSDSMINWLDWNVKDNFDLDLDADKEHHLHSSLTTQTTTCTNHFNQVSDFSSILNQAVLMDTFPDHPHISFGDELALGESHIDDTKSSCDNVLDFESAQSEAENEPGAVLQKCTNDQQSRESLEVKQIQKCNQIIADNKTNDLTKNCESELSFPSQNLCPTFHFTLRNILQSSENKCQTEAAVNCDLKEQCNADKSKNITSSKLSSFSQMDRMSPSMVNKKMKEGEFRNTGTTTSKQNTINRNNYYANNIQTNGTHSIDATRSHLSDMFPSVTVLQPSSSNFCHNALSTFDNFTSVFNLPSVTTNQMLSSLTSFSTSTYPPLTNNNHSQIKYKNSNQNISLLTESTAAQSEHGNMIHNVLSKMTNIKCDPFLSQTSLNEVNNLPGTDIFDDLTSVTSSAMSPLMSSGISQNVSTTGRDKMINVRDQTPSNICHAFMDLSESMTHAVFASEGLNELDSFLNTIPLSPGSTTPTASTTNAQPNSFLEWPKLSTATSPGPESVLKESSDSESSNKPSLLRTLLDKEKSTVQGPKSYKEWIHEQIPTNNVDTNKTKMLSNTASSRYTDGRQTRKIKNNVTKSRELPMLRLTRGYMKFGLQTQKPTKELPLPSSVKASAATTTSINTQDILASFLLPQEDTSEREIKNSTNTNSSETAKYLSLPDDLLDMVVEQCVPLEMGQAEALISDLNGSFPWEDNLYALLDASAQEKSANVSGFQNTQQKAGQSVSSPLTLMSSEPCPNFSVSQEHLTTPSVSPFMSLGLSLLNRKPIHDHLDNKLHDSHSSLKNKCMSSQHLPITHQLSTTSVQNVKLPEFNKDPANRNRKISFLRAAITSPDVDKLIEQIPLGNSKKHSVQETSEHCEDEQDIVITKVLGLQKRQASHPVQIPLGRELKAPSSNSVLDNTSTSKSIYSVNNSLTASDFKNTASLGHACTTSSGVKHADSSQNVPSTADTQALPSTNPLVIKISLASNLPKVITVDSGSQKNKKVKPNSQHSTCGQLSLSIPRAAGTSNTDLSSTHPVSVMIMRKENHRSRRSKTIATQTDNQPGELYPDFELNTADTILYPSLVISYPAVVSPRHDMSPLSTSTSSLSSMSEGEKFVLRPSSSDDSLSSVDDDSQLRSSTPFLMKLLTGELSKDHYQRLDQQLLQQERQKCVSS